MLSRAQWLDEAPPVSGPARRHPERPCCSERTPSFGVHAGSAGERSPILSRFSSMAPGHQKPSTEEMAVSPVRFLALRRYGRSPVASPRADADATRERQPLWASG